MHWLPDLNTAQLKQLVLLTAEIQSMHYEFQASNFGEHKCDFINTLEIDKNGIHHELKEHHANWAGKLNGIF